MEVFLKGGSRRAGKRHARQIVEQRRCEYRWIWKGRSVAKDNGGGCRLSSTAMVSRERERHSMEVERGVGRQKEIRRGESESICVWQGGRGGMQGS